MSFIGVTFCTIFDRYTQIDRWVKKNKKINISDQRIKDTGTKNNEKKPNNFWYTGIGKCSLNFKLSVNRINFLIGLLIFFLSVYLYLLSFDRNNITWWKKYINSFKTSIRSRRIYSYKTIYVSNTRFIQSNYFSLI